MSGKKLSIIIPTLNEERYLSRLLSSIRNQSWLPGEIIVADANSRDRTVQIAKTFGCKVVSGGLPAKGRNEGAKMASRAYLLFLDADVVLPPYFLKNAFGEFLERKLDIATCYTQPLSKNKIDSVMYKIANLYFKITKSFFPHAPGFCIFAKKALHEAIGGFDETIKLAEDHDYVRRASQLGNFDFLTSVRIPASARRLRKDGRLRIAFTYSLCELHLLTLGQVRSDIFRYRFDGYE